MFSNDINDNGINNNTIKKVNNNQNKKDTIKIKIKVPRKEIVFIDMVFKSYEGLAVVTVEKVEKETGILILDVTEGTREDVIKILNDLKNRMNLIVISDR